MVHKAGEDLKKWADARWVNSDEYETYIKPDEYNLVTPNENSVVDEPALRLWWD